MQETERGDTGVLTTLFAHNVWANLKLIDFCEKLTDEQLDARRWVALVRYAIRCGTSSGPR